MEANINSAIKNGYLQQVRFLIEFGHSINERDDELRTPLINCAFISDEEWSVGLARLFIEKGAAISLRDKIGLNALHYATLHSKRRLVQLYLNAIDFNINAVDRYGNTALHYAASTGNVGVTKDLLHIYGKYGLNINLANKKGETALIQAWKAGHFECGEVLVNYEGVDEDVKDKIQGLTAREWQQRSIMKAQQAGVKKYVPSTTARDNRPRTALKQIQVDVNARPVTAHYRPTSAPAPVFNKRPSLVFNNGKENKADDNPIPPVLRNTKTSVFYRPAHMKDMRNNPEHIFQVSPVDYFVNKNHSSYPFAREKRTRSKSHGSAKPEPSNSNNWRYTLKSYLTRYNFQFAHSYRKTAIPPEPEPEENQEERPESPAVSEITESEHGKKGSKKDKDKHDKNSKHQKNEKGPSRRTSTLTVPNNLSSLDSSSTESINTKGLQRRISRMADENKSDRLKSAKPGARDGIQSRTSMIKK